MKFKLPELGYSYDSLDPHIDALTMEIHYTKHHQGYLDKLNKVVSELGLAEEVDTLEKVLLNLSSVPEDKQAFVRNNAGGVLNHNLFWKTLTPHKNEMPLELKELIVNNFGSLEEFKDSFIGKALTHFGSGWVWLIKNSQQQLEIVATINQDNPIIDQQKPLLGVDLWEHAYYLKYQNKRADYLQAWWQVVNWSQVLENYN